MRLTRRGVVTLAGAAVLFTTGFVAGYPLLLALAASATGAVVAALAITIRRPQVTVVRELFPDRVERGGAAVLTLRVRNPNTRRQPGFTAIDRVDNGLLTINVDSLAPRAESPYHNELPTDRRGRHQVGPLTLNRTDALGLSHRQLSIGDTTTLWVYPRVHKVRAIAGGRPRHHHDGAVTSLRGSLDLREVREYVAGDEVRHLHWKATARTGQLMIRDYADPDQPEFTALVDNRREIQAEPFEDVVEVAASLVVAAAKADHRCRFVTPSGTDVVSSTVRQLLDSLCVLNRSDDSDLPLVPGALSRNGGGSLVVVSSAVSPADCAALAAVRSRFAKLIVIVLGGKATAPQIPGAQVLCAVNAAVAAKRWDTVIAR